MPTLARQRFAGTRRAHDGRGHERGRRGDVAGNACGLPGTRVVNAVGWSKSLRRTDAADRPSLHARNRDFSEGGDRLAMNYPRVSSFIQQNTPTRARRMPSSSPSQAAQKSFAPTTCAVCGVPLAQPRRGRPRRFCSTPCRRTLDRQQRRIACRLGWIMQWEGAAQRGLVSAVRARREVAMIRGQIAALERFGLAR
jgi:hypothetical protein